MDNREFKIGDVITKMRAITGSRIEVGARGIVISIYDSINGVNIEVALIDGRRVSWSEARQWRIDE